MDQYDGSTLWIKNWEYGRDIWNKPIIENQGYAAAKIIIKTTLLKKIELGLEGLVGLKMMNISKQTNVL